MLENMNLLERQVFQQYWDDGLLDLFAAAGVFLIGVFWLRDLPVGAAIVPALMVPLWQPLRRRLVEPRMGLVEFTEARERRNQRMLKLVMYLGIAVLILGIEVYFFRDSLPAQPTVALVAGLPALLLALLAVITTILIGSARFLFYAVVLAAIGMAGAFLSWRPGAILAAAGAVMLIFAGVIVARFILTNPIDTEADT